MADRMIIRGSVQCSTNSWRKIMKFSRVLNLFIVLALVLALVPAASAQAQTTAPTGDISRDTPFIPGQMVVAFEEGLSAKATAARAKALAGSVGAMVAGSYSNIALLELDPQADVESLADQLVRTGQALAAQPNYVYWMPEHDSAILGDPLVTDGYSIAAASGDSLDLTWDEAAGLTSMVKKSGKYRAASTFPKELLSGRLWGWDAVEADLIWTNSASGVPVVAVLDTGVDSKHPDLKGKVTNGYDFFNDDKLSADDNGHGTHVAGIIVAKQNYNYKNDESAAGVSNGKVLAVKVLGSQGYGTSYSLAAGILYAARNASVKVINISMAGTEVGSVEYAALNYAINTMGKLVVAAAGNDSTSEFRYPAAWADPGTLIPAPFVESVSDGLISVGAARAPRADDLNIWVDRDDDGYIDTTSDPLTNETFSAEECAFGYTDPVTSWATGTNYGKWVNIVAPGESIYSTTPVSNPFYLNSYLQIVSPGYDTLSGTSMAAAFVSGAAARVYGKGILSFDELSNPNISVKDRLVKQGKSLTFASQGNNYPTPIDPTTGFGNTPKDGTAEFFGVPFDSTPNDGEGDMIMAPFCWPEPNGEFSADQDMTGTRYLNVADAMDRGALWTEIKDASNGQPLDKALVAAYNANTGARAGYAKTVAEGSNVVMINLPVASGGGTTTYDLKVSKGGYTSGYQTFNTVQLTTEPGNANDGTIVVDPYSSVSVPAKLNINVVLDWMNGFNAGISYGEPNLDLLIKLPGGRGFIGPDSDDFSTLWGDGFLGTGTLLDPAIFDPFGVSSDAPYAQHLFDGGVDSGVDGEGSLMSPNEYAAIKYGLTVKGAPYYTPKYNENYEVFVTDIRATDPPDINYLVKASDVNDTFVAPVVRVWSSGYLIGTAKLEEVTSCEAGADWWHAVTINGASIPAPGNSCVVDAPTTP